VTPQDLDPRLRLRHLRCFLETARLESLTAAALALNLSQPAASKTIRELEDILGVDLFDRSGRRLALTPAGRLFQQHAAAGLRELARARDLARAAPARIARLSVGILPTVSTDLFPRAALAFRADWPHCVLRVTTGPNWLLLSQLREGAVDLFVGRMPGPDRMTGLSFRHLYSERIVLAVRPGHPLARAPEIPRALGGFPLILPPAGAVIAPAVRAYLQTIGLPSVEPLFETVSLAFGRKAVQLSDAVWFISEGVVGDEIAQGTLIALDPGTDLPAGPVGICQRADGLTTAEQSGLVQALAAQSRQG